METNGLDGELNDSSEVKNVPDGRHEITELLRDDTRVMIAQSKYYITYVTHDFLLQGKAKVC